MDRPLADVVASAQRVFPFGGPAGSWPVRTTEPLPFAVRLTAPCAVLAAPVLPFREAILPPAPSAPQRVTAPPRLETTPVLPFVAPPGAPRLARARGWILLASSFVLGGVFALALHG